MLMLKIKIPASQLFNEETEEFIYTKDTELSLEHSLVSISKWESKWHKPYIETKEKTNEELLNYIECMTITQNVDPNVFKAIPEKEVTKIVDYINDPMTATTFCDNKKQHGKKEILTAEIIYYYMIKAGIPKECEKWHLNRLITLLRVFGEKDAPPKKMSKNDILAQNRALNAQRRAKMKSKG